MRSGRRPRVVWEETSNWINPGHLRVAAKAERACLTVPDERAWGHLPELASQLHLGVYQVST